MSASNELRSIGQLAQDLQHDPMVLRAIARREDISPALVLNGRAYYSIEAAAKIRAATQQTTCAERS